MILDERYAEAAGVPCEISSAEAMEWAQRAEGIVEHLNCVIHEVNRSGCKEYKDQFDLQQIRVKLFIEQFRASCVATQLAKEAGIHFGPLPETASHPDN